MTNLLRTYVGGDVDALSFLQQGVDDAHVSVPSRRVDTAGPIL